MTSRIRGLSDEAAALKREIARWGEVVRDNNIQAPMQ